LFEIPAGAIRAPCRIASPAFCSFCLRGNPRCFPDGAKSTGPISAASLCRVAYNEKNIEHRFVFSMGHLGHPTVLIAFSYAIRSASPCIFCSSYLLRSASVFCSVQTFVVWRATGQRLFMFQARVFKLFAFVIECLGHFCYRCSGQSLPRSLSVTHGPADGQPESLCGGRERNGCGIHDLFDPWICD